MAMKEETGVALGGDDGGRPTTSWKVAVLGHFEKETNSGMS